ncbi:class I histocompatibility antigen, F10 alpha chain-like isoform 2-T2 [Clarias gariepinus]|uniref:class I histocompatibility antigen, F10 alpha chain-like isoform X2 n=1 Tax=Clarias gariepinus TaxID=13013 RepID=UPI00234C7D95|nr:class I histocompatibility antigen, F10 alpha chain-like isoform X2 [Clarias gariepinus]
MMKKLFKHVQRTDYLYFCLSPTPSSVALCNMRSTPPYPEWVKNTAAEPHWEEAIADIYVDRVILSVALQTAILEFNRTGTFSEKNVYQTYGHCDLYPDGTIKASLTHAFNGNDFISLDIDNKRIIASVPQALKYKRIREDDIIYHESLVSFYKKYCFDRLRVFLKHAPQLSIKNAPEVRVFQRQRAGSNILICHVTGFYPKAVQVKWFGADFQLLDDEINDVLPNGDSTFQTRRSLIIPEKGTEDQLYTCVVYHSSLREGNITVTWDKEEIPFKLPVWILLGCMFMLTVVGLVTRYFYKTNATREQDDY